MNPQLFNEQLKPLIPKIFRSVSVWVSGSGLSAEDLTQDIMLKAIKNYQQYQAQSSIYTWLYTIARNTVYDALRKLKTERNVFNRPAESYDFEAFGEENDVQEQNETIHLFRKALSALTEEQQQLLQMKEYEELSVQQIAEKLQIPEGTVKSRLFKARLLLKTQLERIGYVYG